MPFWSTNLPFWIIECNFNEGHLIIKENEPIHKKKYQNSEANLKKHQIPQMYWGKTNFSFEF